jgi:hypothetical protein
VTVVLEAMLGAAAAGLRAALCFRAFTACLVRGLYEPAAFYATCCLAWSLQSAAGLARLGIIT